MKILLDKFKTYSVVSKFVSTNNGHLYEYNLKYQKHDEALSFAQRESMSNNFELIIKEWN
jgi:hypothetical protein